MFFKWLNRKSELEKRVEELEDDVSMLKLQIDGMQKRTIAERTTEKDTPPSASQILDEWLNGKDEGNGN